MIPATLHLVWVEADGGCPSPFHLACLGRARELHPRWRIAIHTDDQLIRNFPGISGDGVRAAWQRFKGIPRTRSDLLRLCALYMFGGVYLDWDVWVVRPLDDFLIANDELILGWNSYDPPVIGEHVIGAAPGSLKIREAIDYLCQQPPDADGKYSPHLARIVLRNKVEAYPVPTFNPHSRNASGEELYAIDPDLTHALHCYSVNGPYSIDRLKSLTPTPEKSLA